MNGNNFNSLSLNFSKSILDGIELKEKVDIDLLDKLINSTLLKETFNNPISKIYYKTEKQQLEKYRDLITNGYAHVKYERVLNMNCGRSNPKKALGLFSIRREIRHTLAKAYYVDIDIDNCHPVILNEILKQNGYNDEYLQSYIDNRQKWFDLINKHYDIAKICNNDPIKMKEIPKTLFIRIMYGGGLKSWIEEFKIKDIEPFDELTDFIKSIKTTMKLIKDSNPTLANLIIERKESQGKKDYNLDGSVCSYYLQSKESEILEAIFLYLKSKSLISNDSVILCADGLMIEKKFYNPTLLNEFEQLVKKKFNINVKFSKKEMNQDYLEILNDNLNFIIYNQELTTGLLASHFKTMFGNQFMVYEDKLYNYNGTYWVHDSSKKNTSLLNFISSTYYNYLLKYSIKIKQSLFNKLQSEENNDIKENIKSEISKLTIFETKINKMCNDIRQKKDLAEDIKNYITKFDIELDNNPYLFAFNNKIYDLKQGEFIEPNREDYITISCGYDYDEYYDKENKKEVQTFLNSIFSDKKEVNGKLERVVNEDLMNYYLTILATGLCGERMEYLFLCTGKGGNGKSALDGLMMAAVGNYGYKIPSNLLLGPIKEGPNPQVANIEKKRFCLGQEPDKTKRICSSTMKELTGDNNINSRTLQSTKCDVKLWLTLVLECNELPRMDEVNDAIIRRTRVIPFTSKFVSSETYNNTSEEEKIEYNIFEGNEKFIRDDFKNQYKQALLMILFDKFKTYYTNKKLPNLPKECITACKGYLGFSDDLFSWFDTTYELCDVEKCDVEKCEHHSLTFKDIYNTFKSSDAYYNSTKEQKRIFNEKSYFLKIENCALLSKHLKKRNSMYKNKKLSAPIIVGYRLIKESEPEKKSDLDI